VVSDRDRVESLATIDTYLPFRQPARQEWLLQRMECARPDAREKLFQDWAVVPDGGCIRQARLVVVPDARWVDLHRLGRTST
jgi:hypothetical protein